MAIHKHITSPDPQGYQVRIVRNKKEYSRYFSHRQWGSEKKALISARNWRDQMLVSLGTQSRYIAEKKILSNKQTTGVRGVSRSNQLDSRNGVNYIVYSVHWRRNGKAATKSFHVGRADKVSADQEFHAFRTAMQFRREYELHKTLGVAFNPRGFRQWKKERLYN
jgi:hypothetical protein